MIRITQQIAHVLFAWCVSEDRNSDGFFCVQVLPHWASNVSLQPVQPIISESIQAMENPR